MFVLLSRNEAFGITVAEALSSGLPCIVSRTSALAEWIDGKSCFGIDYPIDIKELSGLVTQVARLSPGRRDGIMDWNDVADRTAKVYSALLSDGRPPPTAHASLGNA